MLNEAEFLLWCKRLGLTEKAQAIVAEVRSRPPARRVGGGQSNVPGRYPSRKMGVTIQFESHPVELPFVYELEHDTTVLEYYDQPPSIPLSYDAASGRSLSVMHTPDYFVIRQDAAGWEECKNDPKSTQAHMRHADPHVTLKHYQQAVPAEVRAAAIALEADLLAAERQIREQTTKEVKQ